MDLGHLGKGQHDMEQGISGRGSRLEKGGERDVGDWRRRHLHEYPLTMAVRVLRIVFAFAIFVAMCQTGWRLL